MSISNKFNQALLKEAKIIEEASSHTYPQIEAICQKILASKGKVIITGVGKSGHVGKKIAASFASTGTPSFFMHATEALHGDLGMVTTDDIVILISNSGETKEVLSILPSLKKIKSILVAITSKENSTLAKESNYQIIYHYGKEIDHLNLAPTASSIVTMAIGDALAVTLCEARNFTKEDFHLYHPGGSLGKQLEKK